MVYISVFFSLLVLRFPVLLEFDQGNVIARDREMRESARKGSQDKAALCCSFALFLLLLAQQTQKKVKNDRGSKFSNLSSWKEEA